MCATFNHRPGKDGEAAVVQRSRFLRWPIGPSVHELASSSAKLLLCVVGAVVNFFRSGKVPASHCLQYFVQLKSFKAVGGTISGGRAYTAMP